VHGGMGGPWLIKEADLQLDGVNKVLKVCCM
jgi:hypothetical protein